MAKQYWPERLELVESMPRNPVGEIKKFVLGNGPAIGARCPAGARDEVMQRYKKGGD